MEHLSFDIICRIADGDKPQNLNESCLTHLQSCRPCQQEIELQRSIIKVSHDAKLVNPSKRFTQNVLDVISPSGKKKWYEGLLHNMGNIIAMASVLTFLMYIFSITNTSISQNDRPSNAKSVIEFVKIIQDSGRLLTDFLTSKLTTQSSEASDTNTIFVAFLAIVLLVFIDRIANRFIRKLIVQSNF
jgi:hypothetical protein